MPDAKRPDPKRRTPASRPGKPGDSKRDRPRTSPVRRQPRAIEARPADDQTDQDTTDAIRASIAESAELASEQRFGSAARRAAILAAVVCVLTLTIAGPVRTFFAQRTEMKQLRATEEALRAQIAELEEQKVKLGDPVFIAAQARERLGFVMPGDIPYQVQLPPTAVTPDGVPEGEAPTVPSGQPWYTSLWQTIADGPHSVSPAVPTDAPPDAPPPGAPPPPEPPPAPGG